MTILIVDLIFKIMINYLNGLVKMKKDITLNNLQLQKNSIKDKKQDYKLLMLEFQKRYYKRKFVEKLEFKKN